MHVSLIEGLSKVLCYCWSVVDTLIMSNRSNNLNSWREEKPQSRLLFWSSDQYRAINWWDVSLQVGVLNWLRERSSNLLWVETLQALSITLENFHVVLMWQKTLQTIVHQSWIWHILLSLSLPLFINLSILPFAPHDITKIMHLFFWILLNYWY